MIQVWPTVERFLTEHGAAVLVTLAKVQGSSPREPGARMMVRPDGRFSGTIGGGALEWLALAEAQSMMAGAGASYRRLDKALGPELGQCCGGRVLVTLERFGAADLDRIGRLAAAERAGELHHPCRAGASDGADDGGARPHTARGALCAACRRPHRRTVRRRRDGALSVRRRSCRAAPRAGSCGAAFRGDLDRSARRRLSGARAGERDVPRRQRAGARSSSRRPTAPSSPS